MSYKLDREYVTILIGHLFSCLSEKHDLSCKHLELSMTDEATYAKFLRFFTSRLVQTLVQARLGTKIDQECDGRAGQTDWFNTKIDELGEIAAYLRSAIDEFPPKCKSITIEFLLYTADGLHLPLESWVISIEDGDTNEEISVSTDLYHKLGTILRSAACASRVTPMYRYFVKRQSQDTFIILYRVLISHFLLSSLQIYKGSMDADLGSDAKHLSIAVLPSPYGTLNLDLSYRTNMALPSKEKLKEAIPIVQPEKLPCRPSFSDCIPVVGGEIEECPMQISSTFRASPLQVPASIQPKFRIGRSSSSEESTQSLHLSHSLESKDLTFGPQKPLKTRTESFPFEQLLSTSHVSYRKQFSECIDGSSKPSTSTKSIETGEKTPTKEEPNLRSRQEDSDDAEDDSDTSYVKVYGNPLANNTATLSRFIKDCRMAPMNLDGFVDDDTERLTEQLKQFSTQEKGFKEFLEHVRKSTDS